MINSLFPKPDYNHHRILESAPLGEAILLANDIKVQYEAHRVLTAGSVHGAADSTNVVTAANASDLATAITLANDLKTQYEAHRVLTAGSVHGAADTTNTISAANASDLATLLTLLNELRTDYDAHRVLTIGSVHGAADTTNDVTANAAGVVSADVAAALMLTRGAMDCGGFETIDGFILFTGGSSPQAVIEQLEVTNYVDTSGVSQELIVSRGDSAYLSHGERFEFTVSGGRTILRLKIVTGNPTKAEIMVAGAVQQASIVGNRRR